MRESYIRVKNVLPGKHGSPSAEKNRAIADTVAEDETSQGSPNSFNQPPCKHPFRNRRCDQQLVSKWQNWQASGAGVVQLRNVRSFGFEVYLKLFRRMNKKKNTDESIGLTLFSHLVHLRCDNCLNTERETM